MKSLTHMKILRMKSILIVLAATLLASFNEPARADEAAPAVGARPTTVEHRSFTGTIQRVDDKERTLVIESFFLTRTFTAGNHCRVELEDKPSAALKDLRPGHRVQVQYLARDGVNVAARIRQENSSFTGNITALDATGKTFKVKHGLSTKAFNLGDGCQIVVRGEKGRSFADLKLGHKVTVRFASALPENFAFKIEQSSLEFTGTIEAMDAGTGTLKARQLLGSKTFKLGDDCPIIVEGRTGAKLRDLRLGDKITFHYEDVDGVLIANHLARENAPSAKPESEPLIRKD